ncbi:BTB/POZ domain-containing protein 6 [Aphelenchoides avenae]|nr:BTB/POZ domain-containing protein 6 [Aphelenchus avenae]
MGLYLRKNGIHIIRQFQEKVQIPAHAAVLSTASDSFKAMFYGGFNRESVVEVVDTSPDGFRAMLKYIYTDCAELTEDNIESVLSLANKYLISDLLRKSIAWVKQHVNTANVCRFLPLAEPYSDLSTVWKIVLDNGHKALKSVWFLSLSKDLSRSFSALMSFTPTKRSSTLA